MIAISLAVVAGLVLLWPGETSVGTTRAASDVERGTVIASTSIRCQAPQAKDCRRLTVELVSGPDAGTTTNVTVGESLSEPRADVGDGLRLVKNEQPAGAEAQGAPLYAVTDFERRMPMLWLALGFVLVVLLVGRLRGLRALVGLVASVAIVFLFIVPAVLEGTSPLAVALTGAAAIMLVTVVITHGPGVLSLAAILGTTASLGVTAGLGLVFVEAAHLTGLGSEASTLLQAGRADLSLEGVILAGLIIGALGVLDDVTVSQASTVLALRRANEAMGLGELYRSALRVGQDHSTATVNTLVLAYVGASLPVLLIFSGSGARVGDSLNSELVAEEVVSMLVGSIGLLLAVPLTTLLASWMALRLKPGSLAHAGGHTHAH